jgi:hypothetical protein
MTSALRWFSDYDHTRDSRRAIRPVRILEYEELESFFFNGQSDRHGAAQSFLLDWLVCRYAWDWSQMAFRELGPRSRLVPFEQGQDAILKGILCYC